ncbi:thioesterase, FlK family [Anderseniella sp. Alg231-50]|uniref:thioesterase, FlK family n=1 Tax=Anderseniella sp. Alg231-50 TaxID=1922226 RepID=UPI003FCCC5DA
MTVTVEVTLVDVDRRSLLFEVSARDETASIGSGTHRRAVIDVQKFISRTAGRQRAAV